MSNKHAKLGSLPKKERNRYIQLLTNDPTDFKKSIIRQVYEGADGDSLAYMDGRDAETGEIVPLIVGLDAEITESGEQKFTIYPIARLFVSPAEMMKYEPPDGRGNYVSKSSDGDYHVGESGAEEAEGSPEGLDEEQGLSLSGALLGRPDDSAVH